MQLRVLGKLNDELKNSFVTLYGNVNDNEILVFCDYSEFDIPVDFVFSEIVSENETILCKTVVKIVTQEYFKTFEMVPKGWKTICKVEILSDVGLQIVESLDPLSHWTCARTFLILQS